jgi:hypothetical protein
LPGDSTLRARSILTEKDFSDEELGRIIAKSDADSNDAAYLDAVKREDMETAQRITGYKIDADEAAAAIRRAATNKSRSHVSSNEVIGELQNILAQRVDDVNRGYRYSKRRKLRRAVGDRHRT